MTVNDFIKKNDGKQIGDGQCVSLYRKYLQDVWGLGALEGLGADGGAEGLVTRYATDVGPKSRQALTCVYYDGKHIEGIERPLIGDAVVFGPSPTNKYGHVGIMAGQCGDDIIIFEQNGIAAMRGEAVKAHLGLWSMDRVIGWLMKRS